MRLDAMRGALYMGAFGDAFGLNTEELGLRGANGNCALGASATISLAPRLALNPYTASSFHDGEWGVWIANQTLLAHSHGVISDDTAWRSTVLQRFVKSERINATSKYSFTESQLKARYMTPREAYLWQHEPEYKRLGLDVLLAERRILSDFLVMMDAAGIAPVVANRTRGANAFYRKGTPVVFGLYTYLELALLFCNGSSDTPSRVFRRFHGFSALTQQYGNDVFALGAALTAAACQVKSTTHSTSSSASSFAAFFMAHVNALCSSEAAADAWMPSVCAQTAEHFNDGVALRAAGRTQSQLLQHYVQLCDRVPSRAFKLQDPLVFWTQFALTLGYCFGGDNSVNDDDAAAAAVVCTFKMLVAMPGDTDTVTSELGTMLGAFYGADFLEQRVMQQQSRQQQQQSQFGMLENFMGTWFMNYSYEHGAALYAAVSDL
jgi:hypothetical protein